MEDFGEEGSQDVVQRKNRIRELVSLKGLKLSQVADLCGISRPRMRKLAGNHVELMAWEMLELSRVLELEVKSIYAREQIDIETLAETRQDDEDGSNTIGRWSAALVSNDEETMLWMRQGLLQPGEAQIEPGFVRIPLREGRCLLGRAVEHIGITYETGDHGAEPSDIAANQLLSIIRDDFDDDLKLSRFQLDLTYTGDNGLVMMYVQGKRVKVKQKHLWKNVEKGECICLFHGDLIQLPNDKILRLECVRL